MEVPVNEKHKYKYVYPFSSFKVSIVSIGSLMYACCRVAKISAIKMLVADGVIHGNISDPSHFLPTKDKGVYGAYVLSFSNAKIINPERLQIMPASADEFEEMSDEPMAEIEEDILG